MRKVAQRHYDESLVQFKPNLEASLALPAGLDDSMGARCRF
jgi:hypothetical protein